MTPATSPRARVTTRIMEHARWIAEERRLWDTMMSPPRWRQAHPLHGLSKHDARYKGRTELLEKEQARETGRQWRARDEWVRH